MFLVVDLSYIYNKEPCATLSLYKSAPVCVVESFHICNVPLVAVDTIDNELFGVFPIFTPP